jgi:hypothetical protein
MDEQERAEADKAQEGEEYRVHFTARPLGFLVEQVSAAGSMKASPKRASASASAAPSASLGSTARSLLSPPAADGQNGSSSHTMVSSISKHCEWSHVLQEGDRLLQVGSAMPLPSSKKKRPRSKNKEGKEGATVVAEEAKPRHINVRRMEPERVADQLETLKLPISVLLQRPDLACVSLLKHRGLVAEDHGGQDRYEFQQVWRALSMRVIDMQCRESGQPADWLQKLHGDSRLMRQVIKHQKKWAVVKNGAEKKIVKKAELEHGHLERRRSGRAPANSNSFNTPRPGSAETDT